MRLRHTTALFGAGLLLASCAPDAGPARLDTQDQQASYGVGLNVGRTLQGAEARLDRAAFMKGVEDAMAGNDPALEPEVIQTALQAFSNAIMEEQQAQREAAAESNLAEGESFMAENGAREGVTTTESGLQYEVMREADGPMPTATDEVSIHYKGTLIDGTQFDSSYDRGEPIQFAVGGVIPGFAEGLQLMQVGSQYRFVIPGDLGYGSAGSGNIEPNATLIFEVELLEIVQ